MAYPHISPGDKFRPNAEKENAISRLLDKAQGPAFIQSAFPPEEHSVSLAYNCSAEVIQAGRPAEILFKMPTQPSTGGLIPEFTIGTPAILVQKVSGTSPEYWGIALEEIPPNALGPVQLSGISICTELFNEPPDVFQESVVISVDKNGTFFYSGIGAARVLRSNKAKKTALVYLDQSNVYRGPLAVRYDGDTLTVIDGGDPESSTAGYFYVNGEIKKAKKQTGLSPKEGWLCLKGNRVSLDGTFEIIDEIPSKPEKAGDDDYHPIAQIKKNGESFSIRQISKWEIPQMWLFEDCESEKDGE